MVHYVADKLIRPARNNEVDILIHLEHFSDVLSGLQAVESSHRVFPDSVYATLRCFSDYLCQDLICIGCFRAAF